VEDLIRRVVVAVGPIYLASAFYKYTIWPHALAVAKFARQFAEEIGANKYAAELGGLLHDIGAAKYGKEDHHKTGAKEASLVLLECHCPLELFGLVLSSIYTHRGSHRIPFQTPEAICVAAADAKDHFYNVDELVLVHTRDLGMTDLESFRATSVKLERDWEKTGPEVRALLDGTYDRAKQRLLRIANGDIRPQQRGAPLIGG